MPPMACCGGGSGSNQPFSPLVPGENGLVVLEYTGLNDGDQSWFGSVTGTRYVIGGITKQAYVDERDAPAFLNLWDRGVQQFKQVVVEAAVATAVVEEPVVMAMAVEEPAPDNVVEESAPEITLLEQDEIEAIARLVSTITAWLSSMPPIEQVQQVYEYEKANSNRTTAIAALEAYLGAE